MNISSSLLRFTVSLSALAFPQLCQADPWWAQTQDPCDGSGPCVNGLCLGSGTKAKETKKEDRGWAIRLVPGSNPPMYETYKVNAVVEVWTFKTCGGSGTIGVLRHVGFEEGDPTPPLTLPEIWVGMRQLENTCVNFPPDAGTPPSDPPPVDSFPDRFKYNCLSSALGFGPGGGISTSPPTDPQGQPLFPAGSVFWVGVGSGEGLDAFDDECWETMEECDLEGDTMPAGTRVVVIHGKVKDDGKLGEPEYVDHATTSNGDGTVDDKNGIDEREPAKDVGEVKTEHIDHKGYTDPDGDGVYTSPSGKTWRKIICKRLKEECGGSQGQ